MTREFSAGGLVFKRENEKVLWLLRLPSKSVKFPNNQVWGFPKGHIEKNEPIKEAAIREVGEETGINAAIISKIKTISYIFTVPDTKEKIFKFVTFFLMEFQSENPAGHDNETSEIRWLEYSDALTLLTRSQDKELLSKAQSLLPLI